VSRSLALSLRVVRETLAICIPTLADAAAGRLRKDTVDERLASWSAKVVKDTRMRLTVRGEEHYDRSRTYLVMSNHQSHYDVPVLFHVLGPNLRMVAKTELFRIPIFGPAIRAAGFIELDRSDRASALANLDTARRALADGTNVWIAPEGTRSRTGDLRPFKRGPFYLALDSGLPILPVSIQGTRHVLPAGTMRSSADVSVRVTIHAPLDPKVHGGTERKLAATRLLEDVRATIAGGL
jgi:1-acyl-sn-glycerol-3-phosphate acyltransferase